MAAGPSAPRAGDANLKFHDAESCKAWLAALPLTNVLSAHPALGAQLKLANGASLPARGRLAILETLREPVSFVQAEYAKRCRGRPVPFDANDRAAWRAVVELWRSMHDGYATCLAAEAELGGEAALACQRALAATGLAMFEHCRVYHSVPAGWWRQLHGLYARAESRGFAANAVTDSIGRAQPATSCAATYLHVVLMHLANPDALTQPQVDTVARWLDHWESLVRLSPTPLPAGSIPALAVDLASDKCAGLAPDLAAAASVRHLDLGELSRTLRQAAVQLKQGRAPAELGLGELAREACEKLLMLLHIQWCAAGTGRAEERSAASIKVMISPNIAAMHYHVSGKSFRQPRAPYTAKEEDDLATFGHVTERTERAMLSQRSAALETWVIVNQSASGFLGMCRDPDSATRISHHQLLGLRTPSSKALHLGIVQRLIVNENDEIWVGLRLLPGAPQAVAVRVAEPNPRVMNANKYERALLMPEDAARKIPATLVLLPTWYQANRVLDLYTNDNRTVKLQALLETGSNFERATFTAM